MVAIISQSEFEDSLLTGRQWVAIDNSVYDITTWYSSHPGGKLVLLHSRGRDVSEAFGAYHPRWVSQRLPAFKIGQLADIAPRPCISVASPMQAQSKSPVTASKQQTDDLHNPSKATQQCSAAHSTGLRAVQHALEAQGLFHTSLRFYSQLALWCVACLAVAVCLIVQQHIVPGALLLGLFWQQVCHSMLKTMTAVWHVPNTCVPPPQSHHTNKSRLHAEGHDSCHMSLCCLRAVLVHHQCHVTYSQHSSRRSGAVCQSCGMPVTVSSCMSLSCSFHMVDQ